LATLQQEAKIRERVRQLRQWTEQLAAGLRALGVRTFPTSTYFFLADFSPVNAAELASQLRERQILIKPLQDPRLGPGYLRVTTALPEENAQFLEVLSTLLPSAAIRPDQARV
jgi:histidinol-phosphate aminotransferase